MGDLAWASAGEATEADRTGAGKTLQVSCLLIGRHMND